MSSSLFLRGVTIKLLFLHWKSIQNIHKKDRCWSWSSNTLATWWEELTRWKRRWCWEGLRAGGEGDDRGWDGWITSLTQWTWIWASSKRWWRTGKPGHVAVHGGKELDMSEGLNNSKKRPPGAPLSSSSPCESAVSAATARWEASSHQNPTLLVSWSQISSLQDCETVYGVCCSGSHWPRHLP